MKKIAILVSLYITEGWIGGTEVATLNLAKELEKTGEYDVDVITCKRSGRFKMLGYISDGKKELKSNNYDIIHCQSIFPALIPYLAHKKYFIYCRGSDVMLAKGWRKRLNRRLLKHSEKIIVLTEAMKKKVKEDYNLDSVVIPNAISVEKTPQFPKMENQILFVGTLKEVKGVDYLLEALQKVDDSISLVIAGDGPERNYLERYCSELGLTARVKFAGMVDKYKIQKYISESQILILPSLSEGFSMTLLEAMAGGIPIIATNVGGNPEIIKEGINGCLVEPGNSEEIADKIKYLLSDKETWYFMSKNNTEEVKKYSWDNVINKLGDIWNEENRG